MADAVAKTSEQVARKAPAAFSAGFFSVRDEGSMVPSSRWQGAHSDTVLLGDVELRITRFDPDATVPPHRHDWNSALVVLEGRLTATIDGESRELEPGEIAAIPAGSEHGVRASGAGVRMVDLWWPVEPDAGSSGPGR